MAFLVVVIVVVSVASWISHRTSPPSEVRTPNIERLVRESESFEGKRMRVTGDVRVFEAGTPQEYYVLEQGGQYRVAIHGVPLATLRPLTNDRMTIEGVFHYEEGVGRYIDVSRWATPSATPAR